MAEEFAVIGLGVFGRSVALQLARHGQSVLGIDANDAEVQALASELDAVVRADATDEKALRELEVEGMACAVVAIGAESMEASILATALLRQIGVSQIVARSLSPLHARVLRSVGAHQVVSPEVEMGERLARRLAYPNVLDRLELGGNAQIAEVQVPQAFVGQSLLDLGVRQRHGVSVVAIRRGGDVMATVRPDMTFEPEDVMVVIGDSEAVERLAALA